MFNLMCLFLIFQLCTYSLGILSVFCFILCLPLLLVFIWRVSGEIFQQEIPIDQVPNNLNMM